MDKKPILKYWVYILYSPSADRYYTGQTNNLERRQAEHKSHHTDSTKLADDWELKYSNEFNSRSEAISYEQMIRTRKAVNTLSI